MVPNSWRRNQLWLLMAALLLWVGVGGCADKPRAVRNGAVPAAVAADFFAIGGELAGQLTGNFRSGGPPAGTRLILTSLVNLDNLGESSRFGRTVSEALATELFRRGFEVEELRKADAVMIRDPGGELVLSRNVARLARQHQAHVVVAGTYSLTPGTVIVNVRMLDAASHSVFSVAGLEIQRSAAINGMLAGGSGFGLRDTGLSGYER